MDPTCKFTMCESANIGKVKKIMILKSTSNEINYQKLEQLTETVLCREHESVGIGLREEHEVAKREGNDRGGMQEGEKMMLLPA